MRRYESAFVKDYFRSITLNFETKLGDPAKEPPDANVSAFRKEDASCKKASSNKNSSTIVFNR